MKEMLNQIKLELDWLERLDVTSKHSQKEDDKDENHTTNVHDDFKREMRL